MNFIAQIDDFQLWYCSSDSRYYLSLDGADGYLPPFRDIGKAVCYIGEQLAKVYIDTEAGEGTTRHSLFRISWTSAPIAERDPSMSTCVTPPAKTVFWRK